MGAGMTETRTLDFKDKDQAQHADQIMRILEILYETPPTKSCEVLALAHALMLFAAGIEGEAKQAEIDEHVRWVKSIRIIDGALN
jgi:hypothetical protein